MIKIISKYIKLNHSFSSSLIYLISYKNKLPHQILGVHSNANLSQIKAAYYKLAKIYHPDISSNQNSQRSFAQINQAYQKMINNDFKNASKYQQQKWQTQDQQFDQEFQDFKQSDFAKYSQQSNYQYFKTYNNKSHRVSSFYNKMSQENIQKMFHEYIHYGRIKGKFGKQYQQFFSQILETNFQQTLNYGQNTSNQSKKSKNNFYYDQQKDEKTYYEFKHQNQKINKQKINKNRLDIMLQLNLNFFEAVKGGKKTINIKRKIICQSCNGKSKYTKLQCTNCRGSGYFIKQSDSKRGVSGINMEDCKQCEGRGVKKVPTCNSCKGKIYFEKQLSQNILIPQCVENGSILKLKGRGNQQKYKGLFGDLIIKFNVQEKCQTKNFKRLGQNVYGQSQVSIFEAVLGQTIIVNTIWGQKEIKLKQGTQDGQLIKLKGQGWKKKNKKNYLRSKRDKQDFGDHILKIIIKIPKNVTYQIKNIYKQLKQISEEKNKFGFE